MSFRFKAARSPQVLRSGSPDPWRGTPAAARLSQVDAATLSGLERRVQEARPALRPEQLAGHARRESAGWRSPKRGYAK